MDQDIVLTAPDGTPLNARVELTDQGIVLHSRSGKDRNRDYRQALEMIVGRLKAGNITYHAYLDSNPVRTHPLDTRQLVFSNTAPAPEQFDIIIKAMNAGSKSNSAWRRVLITAPAVSPSALTAIVQGGDAFREQVSDGRLSAAQLRRVTAEHVDQAVQHLLEGRDVPNFAPSRDYDVVTPNGTRLAPKKVFGLALQAATGINVRPEHFTAGIGTPCFQMLEAAGYPVIRKGQVLPGGGVEAVDPELAAAEGQPRLVAHLKRERKPALAAAKRRAMVEQLGYLQCERCKIVPSEALGPHGDAVIEVHHAGTQVGEMAAGHVTRLADLICLCANCHRVVHRELAG